MSKANGKLIIALIIIFGILFYATNSMRSVDGLQSWYLNPGLITANTTIYVILFGLISGYVIAKILGRRV